ncbi:replicative DNA helicase [cyanobacterium endosymbiont of Epithemia clementina EcSB]|uniref:replicative DNA helicase n=1 Tax=cyanobacterium endosymbiont of Epithemia clementina EcSB TaxID=3034674 RepID=UPI00247FAA5A|nr:replicative DNA helicase [cyanobacterium endosymbiont of Epithemia clementina EcSB]WGT66753.1 replicative DNA helicase [cyanobacterium endosymbiont of Epithemia clementina EcSB]
MVANNALPPQNIEAEESILGGILLDRDAMGRIVDLITPDAFYVPVHKEIYEAALKLHAQGKPVDLLTIKSSLEDHQLLEKVGGIDKLMQLLDRTVSAVNIDRYGALIMEKYLRRQLISSGHEIVELGFENTKELDQILDESEKKIFRLTQKRPQEGLIPIADTLVQTYSELEKRHQKISLPGIQTDFYDLDAMTGGLQRSDLIIIAGRPSMGKCLAANSEIVLADGSLVTIEEIYHRRQGQLLTLNQDWKFRITDPSNFIDDGVKPVFRVTTKLGRYIETTLNHPYLTIRGWQQLSQLTLGDKIAIPRKINIFGTGILPEHQVKLLAYLIGDGCLSKNYPLFTNNNPLLQEDFIKSVTNFKGVKVRRKISRQTRNSSFYTVGDLEFIITHRIIFADLIRKVTESNNLSNKKLAKLLRVHPSLIYDCKQGNYVLNQKKFDNLCQILQVDSQELAYYEIASISDNGKNPLKIWLEGLGLWGKDAYNKTIPSIIFELQPQLLSLFLNRLFATNGWISVFKSGQVQLGYCSFSRSLARQIQHLLLRFGIIASIKKQFVKYKSHYKITWPINITEARSITIFIDEIGIFGKEKVIGLAKKALVKQQYETNCDLIPIEIWQKIALSKKKKVRTGLEKKFGIESYDNLHLRKRALSRTKLLKLALTLDDLSLEQLATSEVYWDEIASIEYTGEQQVYDLTIPKTHNFVANDICVHNTAFGLAMAANIAKNSKLPIAIFSLEMSKEQLSLRLLAAESKIEGNRLRTGRFVQNEYEQLSLALGNLSEMPIYIDDAANITVMQIRSQIRRLKAEQKGDLGLVLIDYLQLMEGGGSENRTQELSKITRSLKGLAREINVPIVALSQLSRAVETRNNKRPMMSDLRESGAIEQDADLIMMLYRDEYYNTDTVDRGIAEIIITKHRNGPTGPIKLLFQPEFTQFLNMQNNSHY